MTSRRIHVAAAAALCLSSHLALAAERGVSGRVVDRAGDPVPRAELELRCGAESVARLAADARGRFELRLGERSAGDPGGCRLVARPPGSGEPSIEVDLDPGAALDAAELRLELDLFAERVEVRAAAVADSIGARAIRESLARDAGDALAAVPGVARIRKGGLGHDVVVRGAKGESVAVEIDGQPIHGACPNRMDPPAFHADFAEIERIELAKGPFDVASGGLGGTVALVTRRPGPGTRWELAASAGADGYAAPGATVSHGAGRWSASAGVAARRGDPSEDGGGRLSTELLPPGASAAYRPAERDARAFDVLTAWSSASFSPRPGQLVEVAVTRQEADQQIYPYLAMDGERDDATRARVLWRLHDGAAAVESIETSLGFSRVDHAMDDRLRVSSVPAPRGFSMATDAEARDASARARAVLRSGWTLGFDLLRREWDSTTRLAMAGYRPQASLPGTRLDRLAAYAELRRPLGERLALDLGGRLEHAASRADRDRADLALYAAYHATRSTARDDELLSGTLGLTWTLDPAWTLSARAGSVARAPDPQERYFALRRMGTDWVGDPELDPMRQSALDLGLSRRGERWTLDVNLWASRLDDAITLVDGARRAMVPGVMNAHARTYLNHDAKNWGAEATASAPLGDALLATLALAWTRGERDLAPDAGVVDRDLPELPPATARLALRWQPARWWLEGEGVAADRQDHVDSGLGETPTPGWAVLHLRAGWEGARVGIVAGVENLFDRLYHEHLSYQRDPFRAGVAVPEPGRSWTLALRLRG